MLSVCFPLRRSPSRPLFSEPKLWRAAFIFSSQPLRTCWVLADSDSDWQRPTSAQHLLLPHHSGQTFAGSHPAQTPSPLTYLISKNRLSAERIHVSGPLRLTADISASLLTSFPPIPSHFFPCEFSNGKFLSQMLKWVWIKHSQLSCDGGQLQTALIKVILNDFNTFFNTVDFVDINDSDGHTCKT